MNATYGDTDVIKKCLKRTENSERKSGKALQKIPEKMQALMKKTIKPSIKALGESDE